MEIVQRLNTQKAKKGKDMKKKDLEQIFNMNLQLFAEGDGANGDDAGEGSDSKDGQNTEGNKNKPDSSAGSGPDLDDDKKAKYTDEDVDRLINKKFAKWKEEQQKAVEEAKKLATMDAQQKAEYERDQLQAKVDELLKKNALSEMTRVARKILSEKQINVSDELLSRLVSADAEETKKAVESFVSLFDAAVEKAVKEKLKGEPPKAGKAKSTMTKEEIMKIKDSTARKKAIAENMDLFT